jgi:hypothetical protein
MAMAALLNVAFLSVPVPAQSLVLVMVFSLAAYAPRWASLGGLVRNRRLTVQAFQDRGTPAGDRTAAGTRSGRRGRAEPHRPGDA